MRWSFRTNGNYIDFVHTDETSEAVESVIFHLHNTSRCVSWSLPSDTTRINFTIDEVKYSNILITDIDFDGTAMNSQDDFETGITGMFTGLSGSPGGDSVESVTAGDASITVGGTATNPTVKLPYKVYTALLTQTGTNAPVATVFTNTIGSIVWTRDGVGVYYATLASAFPLGKTFVQITGFDNTSQGVMLNISYDTAPDVLSLFTFFPDGTFSDVLLTNASIEIRVYP